jgi:hypothetical protein
VDIDHIVTNANPRTVTIVISYDLEVTYGRGYNIFFLSENLKQRHN